MKKMDEVELSVNSDNGAVIRNEQQSEFCN